MPVTEARDHLAEVVNRAAYSGELHTGQPPEHG